MVETPDPDEMHQVESEVYWAEFEPGKYIVSEGESREDSETVADREDHLVGVVTEINRDAGDYEGSRTYRIMASGYDKPIMFWGKEDINQKVDNLPVEPPFYLSVLMTDEVEEFADATGQIQEKPVYDVRWKEAETND